MNPDTTSTSSPAPTASACLCCRGTLLVLLISVLMMGIGNGLFLWNEIRTKNLEVTLGKKLVTDYQVNNEPHIKEFFSALQAYGRSNPDFNPVLAKYGLAPAAGAPAAPVAPAAPAAAPKK